MSVSASSLSSSSFNFDGVASGLNTTDIITKLISLEKGPVNQLTQQQTNVKTVSSSTTTVATASAGTDASNGTYTFNVTRMATATSVKSSAQDGGGNWVTAAMGGGLD